jgi:hypothetical protein
MRGGDEATRILELRIQIERLDSRSRRFTPGKRTLRLCGFQSRSGRGEQEKNYRPAETRTSVVQPTASLYTEISRSLTTTTTTVVVMMMMMMMIFTSTAELKSSFVIQSPRLH